MKQKLIDSFNSSQSIIPSSEELCSKVMVDLEFKKKQNIIDMYMRKYVLPAIGEAIKFQSVVITVPLFKTIISEELQEVVLEVLRKRGYTIIPDEGECKHEDGGFHFAMSSNPWDDGE
jgi:hypothetical protein